MPALLLHAPCTGHAPQHRPNSGQLTSTLTGELTRRESARALARVSNPYANDLKKSLTVIWYHWKADSP